MLFVKNRNDGDVEKSVAVGLCWRRDSSQVDSARREHNATTMCVWHRVVRVAFIGRDWREVVRATKRRNRILEMKRF